MNIISDSTQTLHTTAGRYTRQTQITCDGPLGCGHVPPSHRHAWQRVRSLQPNPNLPETICTDCLEAYAQRIATPDQP